MNESGAPLGGGLSGRVALITGGNGGIGGTFARALAARGCTVLILGRNEQKSLQVAEEIRAAGGRGEIYTADVTDEAGLGRVAEDIAQRFGGLNILINAAGGNVRAATAQQDQLADAGEETTFFDLPAESLQQEVDLNLRGTWLPCKVMAPLMEGREGACILNISSMGALTPLTRIPGYSAAKAGVSSFTRWLATYLARSGIRVNALAPGFFSTEQNRALQFNEDGTPKPRLQKILAGTPMGRLGRLEELTGAMLFLTDERASGFVTGVVLPVDGGFSAYSGA